MICVSYTRSRIKMGEAISISAQNEKIAAFVKGRRMTIERKYSDRKEEIDAEDGFLEMKEDGINRKYDCVVFWSMMYFGKDPLVGYNLLLHTFIPAGIDFAVVCDNFFSIGQSAEQIEEYLSNKYKERRMEHGKKIARIAADCRRNTLYGYEKHGDEFVIDNKVKPIVDKIFRLALNRKSISEICKHFNDKGTECPNIYLRRIVGEDLNGVKDCWDRGQVKKILTDKRYKGVRSGVNSNKYIEPYITKEEYDTIQSNFKHYISQTRSDNPLQKMIFDKDSHIRLYMGDYMSNGVRCFYISKKTPEYDQNKKKVIEVQTVFDKVTELINKEIRLAKHIAVTISSVGGQAEIAKRKENALSKVKEDMEALLTSIDRQITPDLEEIASDETQNLDSVLSQSISHKRNIDLALSDKNPWLRLYLTLDSAETLTADYCKKYVAEILIDRFEEVILVSKYNEWKQQLPSYWLEV
ncbi:MAG: recombinase family protein [Eubacteriales bacterium]|nr:recombinase family protein [Eubacteriales bacterium]